jgi:hypothetical protein
MNVKDQTLAALEAVLWFYDQTAGPHYLTRGKASLSDFFESLVREAEREGWMDMHPSAARTYSGFSAKLKQVNGIRIDPVEGWEHAWDGKWRWLMFDLPASEKVMRVRIWRYLRTHGFGCLQRSIWITPFPTSFYDEIALVWCQRSTFVNLQSKWAGARRRGGECVRRHMTRSATKLQPILTATS